MKDFEEKNYEYIEEHKRNVRKALDVLVEYKIIDSSSELYDKVLANIRTHDNSKYSDEEFIPYALYFFAEDGKKRFKKEFDEAWLHHIHNNPHHWNYWVLSDKADDVKALEMPEVYVYEMICDWLSFSVKKGGSLSEVKSFNEKKRDEYIFHPNTRKLVDEIIEKIIEGEKKYELKKMG